MPVSPDAFIETACQYRIKGMSQSRAWKTAWAYCKNELGMQTREESEHHALHGPAPEGVFLLPKMPNNDQAISKYVCAFFKRQLVIDRLHDLKQQLRAEELPDAFSYIKCTLQEVIARAMQERPVQDAQGNQKDGEWVFNPSAAINASKVYMQAVKMQSEIGEAVSDHDDIKTLSKELDKLREDVLGKRKPESDSGRDQDASRPARHEDPSVSALQ